MPPVKHICGNAGLTIGFEAGRSHTAPMPHCASLVQGVAMTHCGGATTAEATDCAAPRPFGASQRSPELQSPSSRHSIASVIADSPGQYADVAAAPPPEPDEQLTNQSAGASVSQAHFDRPTHPGRT